MIKCTGLKFPSIKRKALPDKLIYKTTCKNEKGARIYQFTMFSTTPGEEGVTTIRCFPENISAKGSINPFPSLHISYLHSTVKDKGFGTSMMNFAKTFSKELGCGGNLHLTANGGTFPNRIPHIFYRKLGMTTNDLKTDKKLDKFIKRGKPATYKDFDSMLMYYFVNRAPKKEQSVLKKFISSIFG